MTPAEYQKAAARTLLDKPPRAYSDNEIMIIWNAMGMAGEAGEACDDIKKAIFHDIGLDRSKIVKELGDILWYITAICTKLNIPLEIVMDRNIAKLEERYPDGFVQGGGLR